MYVLHEIHKTYAAGGLKIQGLMQEVNFSAGEVLGSDGAAGEYIYLIAQGQVDVLRSAVSSSVSEHAEVDDDDLESDAMPCKSQDSLLCSSVSAAAAYN